MDTTTIEIFLKTTAVDLLIKILAATAFWIIGRWLISWVTRLVRTSMDRNRMDQTLNKYLSAIITASLNLLLVLGILGYFGVQTTSFAALIAGAGVAIGAAWSGMLGNFAAGAFMLVLRPFKIGDLVGIGGITGTVHEIGLFGTTIVTPDHVMTIVGNTKVFGETILNYSTLPVRRVDRVAQLASGVNPEDAMARLRAEVVRISNVATSPAPEINLLDLNLMGCVIAVRPYCQNSCYWQVLFDTNAAILRVAEAANWPAPMPVNATRMIP